ncbi:MAG: hypothetical protein M1826_006048 [Phylliscum demangeonii]|nr:MAG: hypothetical protein M1826_006048 [Phylliscum demangeonii]
MAPPATPPFSSSWSTAPPPAPAPAPTNPATSAAALLSFPAPHVLLVTLNRARQLNSLDSGANAYLDWVWSWFEAQASLRVAVVTGRGRAFCAGMDLKEWNAAHGRMEARVLLPPSGFGGLSNRAGTKPIVAAVNGLAYGGGCEMVVNADLVVASRAGARFALPEVKRGVVALGGVLPRLARSVGLQRAMELVLTGRVLAAEEALRWGLVNRVVDDGEGEEEAGAKADAGGAGGKDEGEVVQRSAVVRAAIDLACQIAAGSPDAVMVSRQGVRMGFEGGDGDVHEATRRLMVERGAALLRSPNMREGLAAFVEKRAPKWVDSKL